MGFPPRYRNGDSSWCQNPESNDRGRGDQGFCVTFALDVSEHLSCQGHVVHDDDAVSDEPVLVKRTHLLGQLEGEEVQLRVQHAQVEPENRVVCNNGDPRDPRGPEVQPEERSPNSSAVSTLLAYGVRCRTLSCEERCGRMIAKPVKSTCTSTTPQLSERDSADTCL